MSDPSPLTWTLRLKSHKTTILLHTDPLTPFGTIKSHLLTALHESGGSIQHATTLTPLPLPESVSEIQLGRLANPNDASEGFVVGEWERVANADEEDEAAGSKGKGKGKARADGGGGGGAGIKDCPKGAGLKDGAVLAFRWLGDGVWEGGEEGDVDIDGMDGRKGKSEEVDMWGVKLASFEDAYPEEGGMDE